MKDLLEEENVLCSPQQSLKHSFVSLFIFFLFVCFYVYICVCLYMCHVHTGVQGSQKKAWNSLEAGVPSSYRLPYGC